MSKNFKSSFVHFPDQMKTQKQRLGSQNEDTTAKIHKLTFLLVSFTNKHLIDSWTLKR